jgi:hypothetical protein
VESLGGPGALCMHDIQVLRWRLQLQKIVTTLVSHPLVPQFLRSQINTSPSKLVSYPNMHL